MTREKNNTKAWLKLVKLFKFISIVQVHYHRAPLFNASSGY